MLTNNMSARLDVVDKLLSILDGQDTGLDRAMLQESRSVPFAIRIVMSIEVNVVYTQQ